MILLLAIPPFLFVKGITRFLKIKIPDFHPTRKCECTLYPPHLDFTNICSQFSYIIQMHSTELIEIDSLPILAEVHRRFIITVTMRVSIIRQRIKNNTNNFGKFFFFLLATTRDNCDRHSRDYDDFSVARFRSHILLLCTIVIPMTMCVCYDVNWWSWF